MLQLKPDAPELINVKKKKKKKARGSGHAPPGQAWSGHNILGRGCPRNAYQSRQQSESTDNSLPPLMNLNKERQLGTIFLCVCVLVTQPCLTLCDPMDCSPRCSSIHRILQARTLE